MKSLNTDYDVENLGAVKGSHFKPGWQVKVWEYFLRAVVVAVGVFLGGILALIIGLCTGWIEISC